MRCEADSDALIIKGYTVDMVEKASEASNLEEEWLEYFREVDKMVDSICTGPNSSLATELAWKVPIAGVDHPKVVAPGDCDMKHSHNVLRTLLIYKKDQSSESLQVCALKELTITHQLGENSLQDQSSSYVAALQDRVKGWRFIVTKRGYLGVAPPAVRKGGTVAVIKGGCVPFIL
jgi:putative intracellular protease/amidase